jgi:anti-sigma regulatory factor (Ser/Thr protein kinase)
MAKTDEILSIAADFDNLAAATAFVRHRAEALAAPDLLWPKLELVVEEIFLNIVNYAQPKTSAEVEIGCSRQQAGDVLEEMFCVCIRDWGPPFNPLEKEDPQLEQDLESRPIGGLGIYLVRQLADHCTYDRENDCNCFTACFRLQAFSDGSQQ